MNHKPCNTICLVAGKSAGHILPALTIAQNLKKQDLALKIIFISNQTALDYKTLNHNPLINTHLAVNLMGLPTKKFWLLPKFCWQLSRAMWQTYRLFKTDRPKQVISTGGLIAIPVCLIAKFCKIRMTIYELNVIPGKATKLLAYLANEIKVCFKKTSDFLPSAKCALSSYPNRFDKCDYDLDQAQIASIIQAQNPNFNLNRPTILILGGSQGSLFINQMIYKLITQIKQTTSLNLQIIHQTGHNDQIDWPAFYRSQNIPAIVFSYEPNLMPYYKLATLIICRSGAGTLAEILPLKTPCITIPLQTSYTDHQLDNALEIAQEYAWIKVLKQDQIAHNFDLFYTQVQKNLALRN